MTDNEHFRLTADSPPGLFDDYLCLTWYHRQGSYLICFNHQAAAAQPSIKAEILCWVCVVDCPGANRIRELFASFPPRWNHKECIRRQIASSITSCLRYSVCASLNCGLREKEGVTCSSTLKRNSELLQAYGVQSHSLYCNFFSFLVFHWMKFVAFLVLGGSNFSCSQ
ncbi:hypothetical protein BDV11DRAFT_15987 [Aspergillus similis]